MQSKLNDITEEVTVTIQPRQFFSGSKQGCTAYFVAYQGEIFGFLDVENSGPRDNTKPLL